MSTSNHDRAHQVLHRSLTEFYNSDVEYFLEARQSNIEATPERVHLLSWISPGDLVLDVGCGPGDNGRHVSDGVRYVGCDISTLALNLGAELLPAACFARCESHVLPFATGSFDVVLSTYALEHFVFPRESLQEMWRVCRAGGLILLISPAYDDPRALPPSTTHWPAWQRGWLTMRQAGRQIMRHIAPKRCFFTTITRPRILRDSYQSDFDAVHLVSAREVANFFKATSGRILFERRRARRPVHGGSLSERLFEHCRNVLLRSQICEYVGLNLQVVVSKPAAEVRNG